MSVLKNNRRELISAAASIGATLLLPTPSLAQTGNSVSGTLNKFTSREAGKEHSNQLRQIRETLGDKSPLTADGLSQLLVPLVKMGLITPAEAASLKTLFKDIASSKSIDVLTSKINNAFKNLTDKVSEITKTIISIANDSLQSAKEFVPGVDISTAIFVVSSDVSGALTGAAAGGQLGGPSAALVGAVVGSVSSSAIAVFGPKR